MSGKAKISSTASAVKQSTYSRACKEKITNYNEPATPVSSPPTSPHLPSQGGNARGKVGVPSFPDISSFAEWATSLDEKIDSKFNELFEQKIDLKFREFQQETITNKLSSIEEKLEKKQNDWILKCEERITNMETRFNRQLDAHKEEIQELNAQLKECTTTNISLKNELHYVKKREADKLSQNLVLSGPKVPKPSPNENLNRITSDLIKEYTNFYLNESRIASTERFGRKPRTGELDKRGILVKFQSKETKENIILNHIKKRE